MINFCKNKKWFLCISLVIFIVGIAFIFINGVQLDIQFTGGTKISYSYTGDLDVDKAANVIQKVVSKDRVVSTQDSESSVDGTHTLVVSLSGKKSLTPEELSKIDEAVLGTYTENNIARGSTTNVDAYIGKSFLRKGILAVGLAILLIVVFVTIRFKLISGFSAAICALIALFHDVFVVFFVFVIAGIPLNDGFIAVVLTILGYSVNDTLVIYDRIRENKKLNGNKVPIETIVNTSINQCLRRCIVTSILTFSAMFLVFIFALINDLTSVVNFALPLMIGILSGCFSSLCITSPIWVAYQEHKAKKLAAK